ncbi:MAG: IclR family transcriptional regulator [Proteobacteria bacterium]|nr:IclR family transcriptional regulator [Pseudomonadota bacterium]
MAILRVLATAGPRGMALTSIARATGLADSTTHRLLAQLMAERLVARNLDSRHYAIGSMIFELGLVAEQQFDIRGYCRPIMERLAAQAGGTVYLIMRSGDEAVCLDLVEGAAAVRVATLQVGSRRPLGLGAGGLAILAALPRHEADSVFARVRGVIERDWAFAEPLQRDSLTETRHSGVAVIRNRVTPGVSAVGRAFRDRLDRVVGAISVASSNESMSEQHRASVRRQLELAAARLQAELKAVAPQPRTPWLSEPPAGSPASP